MVGNLTANGKAGVSGTVCSKNRQNIYGKYKYVGAALVPARNNIKLNKEVEIWMNF